jgi:translation initiation factor IF-2
MTPPASLMPPSKNIPAKGSPEGANNDPKSLDERKAAALNLLDKEDRKASRKGRPAPPAEQGSVYGHLGKTNPLDAIAVAKVSPREPAAEAVDGGEAEAPEPTKSVEVVGDKKIIHFKPPIIIKELAAMMELKPVLLMQDLMEMEIFATLTQAIEPEIAAKVCEKHGFIFEKERREKGAGVHKVEEVIEVPEAQAPEEIEEDKLQLRPPVVTFMGHVDHGKTSLLDAFRGSRVASGEAGGITQHIGAYQVTRNGHTVTFIDTPGHAAFSEMRARGANVTDIVVLVVAADDGLMPTTFEAIDHCRAAGVTIIVAINKIDMPRADVDRVKRQLQENDLAPEDWGGTTICVEVSAKTGQGLDDLFEMIHLQAEVLELKASAEGPARGIVIEARTEAGKGPTGTVLVQSGTLRVGDSFICGVVYGKVKALLDGRQSRVDSAGPSTPVEIVGCSAVPSVGDELVELENERKAKKLSEERLEQQRQAKLAPIQRSALETLFNNIEQGKKASLRLIVKADAQGSLQAIEKSLNEIDSAKISAEILRQSVGPITEADVLLASASDAVVIGFNTKVEAKAQPVVKREGVQIKLFSIIYELIDQVKEAMLGMLEPETREKVIGHAKVLQVFKLSSGKVGGCTVTDGRVVRRARARVLRDGVPIYDGGFTTLRRFKDDVKEVKVGLECGIKLGRFNDYLEGDVIECYELEKLEQTL